MVFSSDPGHEEIILLSPALEQCVWGGGVLFPSWVAGVGGGLCRRESCPGPWGGFWSPPANVCVCLAVGSWRAPSLIWWASCPLEVASGGRCPWVVGFCQGAGWGPQWVLSEGRGKRRLGGGAGLLV